MGGWVAGTAGQRNTSLLTSFTESSVHSTSQDSLHTHTQGTQALHRHPQGWAQQTTASSSTSRLTEHAGNTTHHNGNGPRPTPTSLHHVSIP
ncbi:hypothetical protein E2C01_090223 [Portunus trituberculatus]|uniref:Uncharacterized protein n=1 Tax=Portunus trituberculatus TaxID=210409 RepID=A0A5B7JE46_PORTR|nr:hypothetical protein [Portunus trituberculatus]